MARELPRIKVKPVVRYFDLVAVDDLLLENSISVSEAVTPCGEVERGQTVEETSGESAETTVAESSIVLLANDILDSESKVSETSFRGISKTIVQYEGSSTHTWQYP